MLGGPELISDPCISLPLSLANLAARFSCSSVVNCSTGRAPSIFSVAVGRRARTVNVQSL